MDAVQRPYVPVIVVVAGAVVAAPVAWLLPVVGGGTALLFGAGLGLAVRHGARDLRAAHTPIPGSSWK